MKIGLVAPVKPSHPYLKDDPAPPLDLHHLRISPWLWFSSQSCLKSKVFLGSNRAMAISCLSKSLRKQLLFLG